MPTPGLEWIRNGLFHPSSPPQPQRQPLHSLYHHQPQPQPQQSQQQLAVASPASSPAASPVMGRIAGNRLRTLSSASSSASDAENDEGAGMTSTTSSSSVVVGVDSSEHSAKALSHAFANAHPGDTVHVCYCYSPLQDYVCSEFCKTHDEIEEQNYARRQQSIFSNFMKSHNFDEQRPDGVKVETHIVAGDPRDKLPELAQSCQAKGIVVCTPEPSPLASLLGSASSDIARNSRWPVTLVPSAGSLTSTIANLLSPRA